MSAPSVAGALPLQSAPKMCDAFANPTNAWTGIPARDLPRGIQFPNDLCKINVQ